MAMGSKRGRFWKLPLWPVLLAGVFSALLSPMPSAHAQEANDSEKYEYLIAPSWTGVADDLTIKRLPVPTAALPRGINGRNLPDAKTKSVTITLAKVPEFPRRHYVSEPEPVMIAAASLPAVLMPEIQGFAQSYVALASIPANWVGRPLSGSAMAPVSLTLAKVPEFPQRHYVSTPEPATLALAALPSTFTGRSLPPSSLAPDLQLALCTLPRELYTIAGSPHPVFASIPDKIKFVMSLAADPRGNIWVGCEDTGIFCYTPSTSKWRQFTTKDGLGDDNAYALAVDHQGRIWAGHLNHSVSVYVPSPPIKNQKTTIENGTWQNYEVVAGLSRPDTLSGPLGERVFRMAVCPTDGDVWIATNVGLARYRDKQDTWSYYTRAEGLPSDQAQALAFAPDGKLYVGTQCDGIAIASPDDDYATWSTVRGPDKMPTDTEGDGLPTNLINDLLVGKDGTVYAATTLGLAESRDQGQTWHYWRGKDYADKVRGLYGGPPKGWQPQPGAWFAEDYITSLAENAQGYLVIGYRQKGYETVNPATGQRLEIGDAKPGDYVNTLLAAGQSTIVGFYGEGLQWTASCGNANTPAQAPSQRPSEVASGAIPSFPSGAKPPTAGELQALIQKAKALSPPEAGVTYLGEDWVTQGDWVGRYGRQFTILCAANWPLDHDVALGDKYYRVQPSIGERFYETDNVRRWLHWASSDQPNVLYDPWLGHRRQAEWDDHGEAYPMTIDGPDIRIRVDLPSGIHRVSLYFMNKDGHTGANRYRDYLLKVQAMMDKGPSPTLATARVRDFWGGTYKQFILTGPGTYRINLGRNYSLNAICSAVMIDRLAGEPTPLDALPLPSLQYVQYERPTVPENLRENTSDGVQKAAELWDSAGCQESPLGVRSAPAMARLAYRQALAVNAPEELLANWRWRLAFWTPQDKQQYREAIAEAWKKYVEHNPDYVTFLARAKNR